MDLTAEELGASIDMMLADAEDCLRVGERKVCRPDTATHKLQIARRKLKALVARLQDAERDRTDAVAIAVENQHAFTAEVEKRLAAEAHLRELEAALDERASSWESEAAEGEAAAASFKELLVDAAVDLSRQASRARSRAKELRSILGAMAARET